MLRAEVPYECRLSDAGLAPDEHQSTSLRLEGVEVREELVALEQLRCRDGAAHRSRSAVYLVSTRPRRTASALASVRERAGSFRRIAET